MKEPNLEQEIAENAEEFFPLCSLCFLLLKL